MEPIGKGSTSVTWRSSVEITVRLLVRCYLLFVTVWGRGLRISLLELICKVYDYVMFGAIYVFVACSCTKLWRL